MLREEAGWQWLEAVRTGEEALMFAKSSLSQKQAGLGEFNRFESVTASLKARTAQVLLIILAYTSGYREVIRSGCF